MRIRRATLLPVVSLIPVRPEDDAAYKTYVKLAEQRDVVGTNIGQFERGVARGQTLRLKYTTHRGFLHDREQQKVFVPVMREFQLRHQAGRDL